ncbi:hypothetical protein NEF87_003771 [Candidatus Lokiarchaeum ossiferum]|uniref:Uncharacterized protein n=1 Tax=Candidatus Lokiarchaeum ossiferum TaxID=2951803 RepID=A0ABY6HVD4_9ARCH|nr:hypothetical protein NEF87_003771 [Candidatus Lokiarchaeum sp. B-35]
MKRNTKFLVSLAFIFTLSSFFSNVSATFPEDWGVTEGDTIYYTAGFDLEINLPDAVWNEINESLWYEINQTQFNDMGVGYSNSVAATFDAKGIFDGLLALPTVFNLKVDINEVETVREDKGDYWVDYDVFNVSINAALPGETYLPFENFTMNYAENIIIPFIDDVFPEVIAENLTAELQESLDNATVSFGGEGYDYALHDFDILSWPDDTNETISEDGIQNLVRDSFAFFDGGDGFPIFVQKDVDLGKIVDEMKDEINLILLQSHLLYLGGVNGLLEEIGLDLIVSEKEAYMAWNTNSPKDIFGALLDAGKIVGIDFLNTKINETRDWDLQLLDDSFYAGFKAGIKWNSDGILENMHFEVEAGVDTVSVEVFGVKLVVDVSEGARSTLNGKYTGKPSNPTKYAPNVDEDWGVTEGSKTEFTSGYDFNLEMPQAVWDLIDEEVTKLINNTDAFNLTAGQEFDSEMFYDSIISNIPRVMNIESYITDMFSADYKDTEDNNGTSEEVNANFDVLVSQFRSKLPGESSYRPPLTMIEDIYNGIVGSLANGLPAPVADNVTAMLEEFEEGLLNQTDLGGGYDLNLLDIASQIVPSIPYYWGTSANSSQIPTFLNEFGVYSESWADILGYALPSTLYIPKDTNLADAYQGFYDFMVAEGELNAGELEEFFLNMSVDRFEVYEKMAYLEWEVEGMDDIFWNTTGIPIDGLNYLCDMFNQTFGVELDNESIYLTMIATLRYDDNGILDNMHYQIGYEMTTNTSEKLSFEYENDISQGAWKKINERFYGEPLIEIYDHWVDPDDQFTLNFGAGVNQELIIESEEYDTSVKIGYDAISAGTLSIQVWTKNPSDGTVNFTGEAIYFAVDVSSGNALTLPITIEVELPADVLALTDDEILQYFQIYTLDESTDEWVFDNFTKSIERSTGTLIIEIDHLSVFAAGYVAPPADEGNGDGEDEGGFKIPGYTPLFVVFASLGAITLIIKKRK